MASDQADIFVSYSRRDRAAVRRLIDRLREAGATVWWDEQIDERRWDWALEQQLASCRYVLGVLSPNVIASTFDTAFAEMRRGREAGKLVPIIIGRFALPLPYEGLTALVQSYFFDHWSDLHTDAVIPVLRACGVIASDGGARRQGSPDGGDIAGWFRAGPRPEVVSFAIALAVLEHAPLAQVQKAAASLARIVEGDAEPRTVGSPSDLPATTLWAQMTSPTSHRLEAAGSEVFIAEDHRLGRVECCRFPDPKRAQMLLAHIWREFDPLRPRLLAWLRDQAKGLPTEDRFRLAHAIGRLAQTSFASVFDQILRPWSLDESEPVLREVADYAFAVAGFEPEVAPAIERIVLEWARRDSALPQVKAAIEVACGYTGSRMNGLSMRVLRLAAERHDRGFALFDTMSNSVRNLLLGATELAEGSLFDAPRVLKDLAQLVTAERGSTNNRLPLGLFMATVGQLPFAAGSTARSGLELQSLLQDPEICAAMARVFAEALRDAGDAIFSPRDGATNLLKHWAEQDRPKRASVIPPSSADTPMLDLARTLFQTAQQPRERDRIAFLFRNHYRRTELDGTSPNGA